jgi:hypothetical protein
MRLCKETKSVLILTHLKTVLFIEGISVILAMGIGNQINATV